MCGIAGIVDPAGRFDRGAVLATMSAALAHRGPDDEGFWEHAGLGVGFAHRRLSIVDLSAAGHQPMHSHSGRYVLLFNGEIYNHQALRRELEPLVRSFRGHSDTEVFLTAIEHWGLERTLQATVGMFAFALLDVADGRLHLVRDRPGKKPLYYGRIGGAFAFASELKAIAGIPGFGGDIDRDALAAYFRHNYVPAPRSVYQGLRKLEAGTILTLEVGRRDLEGRAQRYWFAPDVYRRVRGSTRITKFPEAVDELDRLLGDAVGLRMIADVPLGAFLSGGIDSSVVVALMQRQASAPTRTFTIGFEEAGFDEAAHARRIAAHLGTDHTELYLTAREARDVIPLLPTIFDEPFADSSQIPTYLVSRLAGRSVKVALSGDGGDEVFMGYERYRAVCSAWGRVRWMPGGLRRRLGGILTRTSPAALDRWLRWVAPLLPSFGRARSVGEALQKAGEVVGAPDREHFYRALVSHEKHPDRLVLGAREPTTPLTDPQFRIPGSSLVEHASLVDWAMYLPDDILVKVDRASMAVSLEARAPILDHRVVEFAWSLPTEWKLHGTNGKRILRAVAERYVPRELIERPKMGFGIPLRDWLRGPLRDWATDLLAPDSIRRAGLLDPVIVSRYLDEHLSGTQDWHARLWDILMLQAWLEARTGRWRTSS
jgi:asparagine synthase (glutamine-hydrolysing)